jgi:sulfur relay (sulfurtransferase) DsrF/TusC family protein
MPKNVFVSFLRSPVGSIYPVEGLRAAGGMLSGADEHKVTVAFMGKGARCAIKGVDLWYASKFMKLFPESGGKKFYVEEESLKDEGIDRSQVADEFAVIPRAQLRQMMLSADICLSF